jgi:hypothetical protein
LAASQSKLRLPSVPASRIRRIAMASSAAMLRSTARFHQARVGLSVDAVSMRHSVGAV